MFCPNCGTKSEDGNAFCQSCGAKLESVNETVSQEVTNAQEVNTTDTENVHNESTSDTQNKSEVKDKIKGLFTGNYKGIAKIVIAVVVLFLVVKILGGVFSGKPDSVVAVYDSEDNKSCIYRNTKLIDTVEGEATVYTNMDKSIFYVLSRGKDRVAYEVKGNKLKEVMDDCQSLVVAAHADTALLIDSDDYALFRYNGSKLEEIADEKAYTAIISGDGKYYAYNDGKNAYIGKKAGKATKVKDVNLCAMSKDGKYTYATSENSGIVVINRKGEKEKIAKESATILALNEDGTEIMFKQNGKVYVSVKGKEKQKVANAELYNICYEETEKEIYGYLYPVSTFKKTVVYLSKDGDSEICLISNKYEAEKIVDDVSAFYGVKDGFSKVYYKDGDDLCYAKVKKDADKKEITDDVRQAFISEDAKDIYIINTDDELCYVKGNGKTVEIKDADEISASGVITEEGLYLMNEEYDGWYFVDGKKITELDVKNLLFNHTSGNVYGIEDDNFYSVKGKKLKKLKCDLDNITSWKIN